MSSYSSDDRERQHHGAVYYKGPRGRSTGKLVGLFTATAVVVGVVAIAGAVDDDSEMATEVVNGVQVVETQGVPVSTDAVVSPDDPNYCVDENGDNYCDDDGSSINPAVFMLIAAANIDTDVKTKKYYRSGTPDATRTYRPPQPSSAGKTVSTPPPASTTNTTPPSSAKGTGTVVTQGGSSSTASKPSTPATSSSGTSVSSSSSKSSASTSSSSSSGISKSSGSGGIGSSSSSSSS